MSEEIVEGLKREARLRNVSKLYAETWPGMIDSLSNEVERLKDALWRAHNTAQEAAMYSNVSSDDAVVTIRDEAMASLDPANS